MKKRIIGKRKKSLILIICVVCICFAYISYKLNANKGPEVTKADLTKVESILMKHENLQVNLTPNMNNVYYLLLTQTTNGENVKSNLGKYISKFAKISDAKYKHGLISVKEEPFNETDSIYLDKLNNIIFNNIKEVFDKNNLKGDNLACNIITLNGTNEPVFYNYKIPLEEFYKGTGITSLSHTYMYISEISNN